MNCETRNDEVERPLGERILEARDAQIALEVGGGEHRLALVDPDEPRSSVAGEDAPRRLAGADAEVEDVSNVAAFRGPRRLLLQLVEDRDVGLHVLEVRAGIEVELGHCSIRSAPTKRASRSRGRSRETGRAPRSHHTRFTRSTPVLRSKTGSMRPISRSPWRIGSTK